MLSEKQLAANRANAQKSSGPKSQSGKKRSSLNAVRHGLTGQVVVLPNEDMQAFHQFTTEIIDSFKPGDPAERQLAQSYAGFQWRINRAAAIEDNLFTLGIMEEIDANLAIDHPEAQSATANARTFRDESPVFDRISLYTQRLVNGAAKVLKELKQLQAERKEREQKELADASLFYQYHRARNESFDPTQNGFALTIAEIKTHLFREDLRKQPATVMNMVGKRRHAA